MQARKQIFVPVDVVDAPAKKEILAAVQKSPVCLRILWTGGSLISVEVLIDTVLEDESGSKLHLAGRVKKMEPIQATPYLPNLLGRLETVEHFDAVIDAVTVSSSKNRRGSMNLF